MAKRRTGITANTSKQMIIDVAAVYVNYDQTDERLVGATEGGVTFTVEQTIHTPELDGAKGPVKGTRRIISAIARATFSPKEWTKENFIDFLPGAESTVDGSDDVITRSAYELSELTNIAIVGTKQGTTDPIVIILKNALADGDTLEMAMEDEGEASPEVQVTAHYDPANMDDEPWEIRNPQVS